MGIFKKMKENRAEDKRLKEYEEKVEVILRKINTYSELNKGINNYNKSKRERRQVDESAENIATKQTQLIISGLPGIMDEVSKLSSSLGMDYNLTPVGFSEKAKSRVVDVMNGISKIDFGVIAILENNNIKEELKKRITNKAIIDRYSLGKV